MKKLKTFIVDDEIIMCEALQRQLEQITDIEVIGIYHDGEDAINMVEKLKPDLVFLDIRMPGLTGLEMAAILEQKEDSPFIVFVTAYDEFALKAYEVDAMDYILKPFDPEDIERVMRKLRKHFSKGTKVKAKESLEREKSSDYPQKFCAYKSEVMVIVDSQTIQLFCAEDGDVFMITSSGEKYLLKQTLQEVEKKLDNRHFFRCHRNYIVNMDFVKQISPWFNRGYLLSLKGEKSIEVPVSRAHTKSLEQYIYF